MGVASNGLRAFAAAASTSAPRPRGEDAAAAWVMGAKYRARPFLKWAGGKKQLLRAIASRFPQQFGCYHEPFLGGGAVFFGLEPCSAVISDINEELIATYKAVRDNVQAVIGALERHRATSEHYYRVRARETTDMTIAERAARMIFLNRTCFNGLYRVNRKGNFNVPFGRHTNLRLYDRSNLLQVAQVLRHVDIRHESVFSLKGRVRRGDLVYFDPPYDPVSPTSSFTSYTTAGFGRDEQVRLASLFAHLADHGVHVVLSNSDTPFIRRLYTGFRIDRVMVRRAINNRGDKRGAVGEVLVSAM